MSFRKSHKHSFYVTILVFSISAFATIQAGTGSINVTITRGDGLPLAGALIVVESRAGETQQSTTDEKGNASIINLEPGLYRIMASRQGFVNIIEPSLRVVRDKTTPFRIKMRVAEEAIDEVYQVAEKIQADSYGSVSTTYLNREHLRTAVGSGSDVLRALDGLPGLTATSGEFASFTVRGRGPRDNLILVDGIPYDKVVHFDESLGEQSDINGGGRFSIFAPTLIEGAEFSPGGWGAAYGGRNGSLLKLDLARGNPSPSASFRYDLAGLEMIYDGPSGFHDDTTLIFSARRLDFGQLFETIEELDIGEPVMTDVILKTHTLLNSRNTLEFLALYTPETNDRDVTHVLASENFEDRQLLDTEQDSALFGVNWTHFFGSGGKWENRVYARKSDKISREGEAFPDSMPMALEPQDVPAREDIFTLEEKETEIGWRSDVSMSNSWGMFSTGLRVSNLDLDFAATLADDWIRYEYHRDDFRPDPTRQFIVLTPEDTNSAFSRQEFQYGAFVEQVFQGKGWDLRTGLRYDYDGFSSDGTVSPRLAANYRISPSTRMSFTAGTYYQSPRFVDRAADPANFSLKNEKTNHLSLGINRRFGKNWDVLVEGYYQDLRDLVTDPDPVTGLANNNGEGRSYGLDVVVNSRFDHWTTNAVYSYNNAVIDDNDGTGAYDADFNYEHFFSLGATWEINNRWRLGFRGKYATGRPRDDFIIHSDVLADRGGPLRFSQEFTTNNTLRWDDFHTLNFRLDYRRSIGPVDFIGFLDVINVNGSSPSDEQEFNVVTGVLKKDEGETTPLIGIRFEKTW